MELMPRLGRAILRHESNDLIHGRLTLPQYWALEKLLRSGPAAMRDLAAALSLKSSTATMMMDGLAAKGLVRRERAEGDRRIVRVGLTTRGRRVLDKIHVDKRRSMKRMSESFSPEDRVQYIQLMEKMVGALGAREGRGS